MGLAALALVLVCAIGVTTFLLMSGDDGDDRAGDDTSSSTTSSTAGSPSASDTASPGPTDPGSSTTPSTPPTPYTPSDDGGDDIHADVKAADFPGDWDFKLGDVEHSATLDDSWDHATCSPVEEGSTLTQQRCEYAVQWTYTAMGGRARVTHLFLVFDNEQHAKAVEADLEDKDFDLREGSLFPDFVQGKWNKSVYGNVVGVTIGTTNTKVPEERLQSLVNYMNTDYRLALSFKGL